MKILHSSDWHLGKKIENKFRYEEQEAFLKFFCEKADECEVDLVIIAGDIYDKFDPKPEAERLLYRYLKKLSNNGKRLILLIAGNHDSPEKLVSISSLAMEHGIVLVGTTKTIVETGAYGQNQVLASGEGMIEVEINNEKAVILTVPFVDEYRINEVFTSEKATKTEKASSYNEKIKQIFTDLSKYYREDTINLATTHIFTNGAEEDGAERMLGNAYICSLDCFPQEAQYVALGHIHKPWFFGEGNKKIRYSGSPIHYNKREVSYQKKCILVEVSPQEEAVITTIDIPVFKPIEIWSFDNIEDAIAGCKDKKDHECWAYLEIKTDRPILQSEIKAITTANQYVLSITPIIETNVSVSDDEEENVNLEDLNFLELFSKVFNKKHSDDPTDEILKLVNSINNEEAIPSVDAKEFEVEEIVFDKIDIADIINGTVSGTVGDFFEDADEEVEEEVVEEVDLD